jgi:hypothetical protein
LHELDGNPARQYNDVLTSRPACAQQCARQFVERIVPSYDLVARISWAGGLGRVA